MRTSTATKFGILTAVLATTMATGCVTTAAESEAEAPDVVDALTNDATAMSLVTGRWVNKATPVYGRLKFIELQPGGRFNAVFWVDKNISVSGTFMVGAGSDSAGTKLIQLKEVPSPGEQPQLKYPTKTYTIGASIYQTSLPLSQVSGFSGGVYSTYTTQNLQFCDKCSILDYSTNPAVSDNDPTEWNTDNDDVTYKIKVTELHVDKLNAQGYSWDAEDNDADPYVQFAGALAYETSACSDKLDCYEDDLGNSTFYFNGKTLRTGLKVRVYDWDGLFDTDPKMGEVIWFAGNSARDGVVTLKPFGSVKSLSIEIHKLR